jgi:DNA-binding NarL/FixJ family response regulator
VREGIAAIVDRDHHMSVVAEAADGATAVEEVLRHAPDVTLMDLRMPGMSGLEALHAIRKVSPSAQVLMLTTYDGEEDIYRALERGARGYLLKDLTSAELLSAIRAVAAGQRVVPSNVASGLADRLCLPSLTDREEAILKLIVGGRSNKEIGALLCITAETVKTHVKSLFLKLEVTDRTQAATAALRRGFVHVDELRESRRKPRWR